MNMVAKAAAAACAILAASMMASAELRQVLVVSRHGVRGPYGPDDLPPTETNMQRYSKNKFPFPVKGTEWGTSNNDAELVTPKITKHGAQVIRRMGEYFAQHLYPSIAAASASCGDAFAYADDNERDYITAQEFLHGFLPTCADLSPVTNGTRLLFEQGQDPTATCPVASHSMYEGIVGASTTDNVARLFERQIARLNAVVDCCEPVVCNSTAADGCDLFHVPSTWTGKFYDPWHDSLSEAQFLSEWFLLQSLNNMSLPPSMALDDVVALGAIHKAHMDLVTNQFNSENFGSTLLVHLVASMQQTIQQSSPEAVARHRDDDGPHLLQSLSNTFLFYAGHDINLLFLKNLLRLEWETENWLADQPNPGSMLVLELHADRPHSTAETDFYVEAFFMAASPTQIRHAQVLTPENPPDRVPVAIPHCSQDIVLANGTAAVRCAFSDFKHAAGLAIRQACVSPSLAKFAASLLAPTRVPRHSASWAFKVVVVTVLSVSLLLIVWKYIARLNQAKTPVFNRYTALE
ncbi:hypothetical protein H310_13224 [Aphanomyces invadans]|uniref:Histidine acid phosphatase n=1 Tax=Aphanomyces invadans TaxID=157072 RepID=A0A024TG40_9STRA|nr:hypothetical protein H310_13224 [Aphanomyces invadans]ETV92561.1 hypothetical protein H310_13224 [Aphanomyces invadans]|eukprot:XP_008878868.1 hypothetical protein H310_13224 [Aphanomyces invadans]